MVVVVCVCVVVRWLVHVYLLCDRFLKSVPFDARKTTLSALKTTSASALITSSFDRAEVISAVIVAADSTDGAEV